MHGRFEFYGAPDIDREMRLEEVAGMGRGKRKTPGGRGLRTAKPAGGRGLGPGGGKGPFRGTGLGPGTGECVRSKEEVEEELARLEFTTSLFPDVRERRIQEVKAELRQLQELAQNYSQMTLGELARVIRRTWKKVNYAAKPYLDAMATFDEMDPYKAQYMMDPGSHIVNYFLANAATFRGPEAKAIKAELKKRLKR